MDSLQSIRRHLFPQSILIVKLHLAEQIPFHILVHILKIITRHNAVHLKHHHFFLLVYEAISHLLLRASLPGWKTRFLCFPQVLIIHKVLFQSHFLSIRSAQIEANRIFQIRQQLLHKLLSRHVPAKYGITVIEILTCKETCRPHQ
ncbi:unknown [Bacteroides cellulosilyticus CAG:158]|nr:unknown [Bacteroides cellulosilyticus CAG:158]